MRTLAWVLGLMALIGSCPLGVNWLAARDGLRDAVTASGNAGEELRVWEASLRLGEVRRKAEAEIASLAVRDDELALEVARLQGRGVEAAEKKLSDDQKAAYALEAVAPARPGPKAPLDDERVLAARKRLKAARSSASVYRGWIARDEELASVLGGLWLAFGLAVLLAAKNRRVQPA